MNPEAGLCVEKMGMAIKITSSLACFVFPTMKVSGEFDPLIKDKEVYFFEVCFSYLYLSLSVYTLDCINIISCN